MYIPKEFNITDSAVIESFLEDYPLGTLISSQQTSEPFITHLPFLAERKADDFTLETHLAAENPQANYLTQGKPVVVVFQGENGYVSSSVYTHHNVPTWNYQAVHMYGTVQILSQHELEAQLTRSVDFFERNRKTPLNYANFDRKMIESYLPHIKGVRIEVYKVEAAFKLSQNRNETDFHRIVSDLESSELPSNKELARVMKNNSVN
jgi:transcriptional regulator